MSVDIVVGEKVLLEGRSDLREHEHHFFEFLLLEKADHGVDFGADAGGSWLPGEEADLAEEVTAFQCSDKDVTTRDRIFDVYLALAGFDEEESVVFLALIDQWVLRVEQHELQGLDEEVDEGDVLFEELAFEGDFFEDELNDFISQRGRQALVEVLELLLTVLGLLGVLQVAHNILL